MTMNTVSGWKALVLENLRAAAKAAEKTESLPMGSSYARAWLRGLSGGQQDEEAALLHGPVHTMALKRLIGSQPEVPTGDLLRLNLLSTGMHALGVEMAISHLLVAGRSLKDTEVEFFREALKLGAFDGFMSDMNDVSEEFVDLETASERLIFVKHEGSQNIFAIEVDESGEGKVWPVDTDARRIVRGDG